MSAKERKRDPAKERKRAQNGAKERFPVKIATPGFETTIRDAETTIKIKFSLFEGGGAGVGWPWGREESRPKTLLLLVGNATTIKI